MSEDLTFITTELYVSEDLKKFIPKIFKILVDYYNNTENKEEAKELLIEFRRIVPVKFWLDTKENHD